MAALAGGTDAQAAGCFENGAIVTFDGVASPGSPAAVAHRSGWTLNLAKPICVVQRTSFAPIARTRRISAIPIIGTPPPLGVPLALTGKLLLGRTTPNSTIFVALEVIRGRKVGTAGSAPAPNPDFLELRTSEARCDRPPYGGTAAEFKVFVSRFGRVVSPAKILAGVCNAKFGRSPRAGLHKLGFSDAKIEAESTEQLAADTIRALKSLVNTIE